MKVKKILLVIVLTVMVFSFGSAEDLENPKDEKKFSIGLDNLPWNSQKIALRWWNKNHGFELTLGSFNEYQKSDWFNSDSNYIFDEIRLNWLKRKQHSSIPNLYLVKGLGISTGFRWNSSNYNEEYDHFNSHLYLMMPIGIEHFPIKSFQNFSYSFSLDPYIGTNYNFYKTNSYKSHNFDFIMGVKMQFFLRLYLK
jgi:opacity protein-like surface antigen